MSRVHSAQSAAQSALDFTEYFVLTSEVEPSLVSIIHGDTPLIGDVCRFGGVILKHEEFRWILHLHINA